MDPLLTLELQLRQFSECANKSGVRREGLPIAPADALRFAETLLLLLSEAQASKQMSADPAGARAFWLLATIFVRALRDGTFGVEEPPPSGTLWFELATAVQQYAQVLLELDPER